MKDNPLYTKRLILRKPKMKDTEQIFSASRYPGFTDGMMWEPAQDLAEVREIMEGTLKAWDSGQGYSFSICYRDQDTLIGRISIRKTNREHVWDVGFWTHPEEQGKGIMTEALAAVLTLGFTDLKAHTVTACYALWNKASERVLHNCGFTFKKHIEQGYQKKGQWVEENLVEIKHADFNQKEESSGTPDQA